MPKFSRRNVLKIAAAGAVATAGTSAAVQQLAASGARADEARESFDEVYKGRKIQGTSPLVPGGAPQVLVDGVLLHVMVNDDKTYTSILNHYQSFDSLQEVAKAAVDYLGDAPLVPIHHQHD